MEQQQKADDIVHILMAINISDISDSHIVPTLIEVVTAEQNANANDNLNIRPTLLWRAIANSTVSLSSDIQRSPSMFYYESKASGELKPVSNVSNRYLI